MAVGLSDTFLVVVCPVALLTAEEKWWMCREEDEPEVEPRLYCVLARLVEEATLTWRQPQHEWHVTPKFNLI